MTGKLTLAQVNALTDAAFVQLLGPVWEHAAWVAEAAAAERPFATVAALHAAMLAKIRGLSTAEIDAFLARHPDVGGSEAQKGRMTLASTIEQGGLALTGTAAAEAGWDARNAAYRVRFGFPFILCLRRHSRASAEAAFHSRIGRTLAEERRAALDEIAHISRLRLTDRVQDPDAATRSGRIIVSVTDPVAGGPAPGLAMRLVPASPELAARPGLSDSAGQAVFAEETGPLRVGIYTLELRVLDYFRAPFPSLSDLALPLIVSDPDADLHCRVVLTPQAFEATTLPVDPVGRNMKEIARC